MMERYPRFTLHLNHIAENAAKVAGLCAARGVTVEAVVKGVCADPRVAGAMLDGGCASLADSRVQNLAFLKKEFPTVPRTLLRIPMKSELEDAVRYASRSLVSVPESVAALDDECRAQGAEHAVLLMFDLGDRREGVVTDAEMGAFVAALKKASHVTLVGVGVNFGCFAGVLPSPSALRRLCLYRQAMEEALGYSVPLCSGGSTSTLALLESGELPAGVNHLRVGEAILLGRDVSRQRLVPWLRQDTAWLEAEVAEVRIKPSIPEGESGADAFGNLRVFADEGPRRRAIVAIGRQDVPAEALEPQTPGIKVLGASSDHTILDVTDSAEPLAWGSRVRFSVNYAAMLALMTSPYVCKDNTD
ncbi:MAG: alanine/ornithine racemase family PLP-dependent enzyme [Synergistaceae bacterium]|jgi:predicted amino acid racemase|nr:alanine/ornithine racemase family PLP-dependent enzyme [Synergistaceae bacterium]